MILYVHYRYNSKHVNKSVILYWKTDTKYCEDVALLLIK